MAVRRRKSNLGHTLLLADLTQMTGAAARSLVRNNLKGLCRMSRRKSAWSCCNQYVLGYRPSDHNRDGKWRKDTKSNCCAHRRDFPPLTVYAAEDRILRAGTLGDFSRCIAAILLLVVCAGRVCSRAKSDYPCFPIPAATASSWSCRFRTRRRIQSRHLKSRGGFGGAACGDRGG